MRDASPGCRPRAHRPDGDRLTRRHARTTLRCARSPRAPVRPSTTPTTSSRRRSSGCSIALRRRPAPGLDGRLALDGLPEPRPLARAPPPGRPAPAARGDRPRDAGHARPRRARERGCARDRRRHGHGSARTRDGSSSSPRPARADRGSRRGSGARSSRRGPCSAGAGVSCARRSPSPPEPHVAAARRAAPVGGVVAWSGRLTSIREASPEAPISVAPSRIRTPAGARRARRECLLSCRHGARGGRSALAGPGRLSRGLGPPEAPRGGPRGRPDPRPAAAPRAPRGADARSPGGRRPRARDPGRARTRGIEVLRVERGGEVTYHGPGPARRVPDPASRGPRPAAAAVRPRARGRAGRHLRGVRRRRAAAARAIPAAGWTPTAPQPRKIGALGIRVERGVAYHGIALNVGVDLADFDLIDACGMPGVVSTSIAAERGQARRAALADRRRPRRRRLRRVARAPPRRHARRRPAVRRQPGRGARRPRAPGRRRAGLTRIGEGT